jgi:hypothetical protein
LKHATYFPSFGWAGAEDTPAFALGAAPAAAEAAGAAPSLLLLLSSSPSASGGRSIRIPLHTPVPRKVSVWPAAYRAPSMADLMVQ